MPAYKIASADLVNTPLLRHVAQAGKPMILSTGGATLDDVRRGYDTVAEINGQVALLQCTAGYPAEWHELDLRVITTYRDLFPEAVVGLSSHDNGIAMAVAAYVLGARIVEKHFTLNRALKGTDHKFSLEPTGLRKMVRDLTRTRIALGDGTKTMYPSEIDPVVKMAKKLVAAADLPAGHRLEVSDIAMKSPGDGLPPYELDRIVGRTLRHPVQADGALTFELLDELAPQAEPHAMAARGTDG
jgi:N-acetylneuraminate synthase/sialic acid synthase